MSCFFLPNGPLFLLLALNASHSFIVTHRLSHTVPRKNKLPAHTDNEAFPKAETAENEDVYDEFGLKLPHCPHYLNRNHLLELGPNLPEELWRRPEKPVGFIGIRKQAPDTYLMNVNKARVVRQRKKKFLQVVYRHVRRTYKEYIRNARNTNELLYWRAKLAALPRNSSPTVYNNHCMVTGRFRAYYRFFGLSRHLLRKLVNLGYVPGVTSASW